jgi:hypothetical protein
MKKLDDIPKKHPFNVPDGYFDKLPGIIQSRIERESGVKESRPYLRYALQYALPVVVLAIVAVVYLIPQKNDDVDSLLASVSTEAMVLYLEESELTTDELLTNWILDDASVEAIEAEVYFNLHDLENIDDLDIDFDNF